MTPTRGNRIPAIVVGRGHTGLGALRSLVLAGIPAYVACPPSDLATRSRWYRPVPGATGWDGTPGPPGDAALKACTLPQAVLVPGADDAALWIAGLGEDVLAGRLHASSSTVETLRILQDKALFAAFLREAGVPHPRSFRIESRADLDQVPFEELDKVFIKPADSQLFSAVTGAKGIWTRGRQELEQVWSQLDGRGFKVIAQEYIPGGADQHYFVDGFRDRGGTLAGLFARRRLRIFPPDFGNSSYCECVPLDHVAPAIAALAKALERLAYRGIFSAEFKRDARDGQFRLLEVNTRAWWYVEFAARCGVNVCAMAHDDALGLPLPPSPGYAPGAGCVSLAGDLHAALRGGRRTPWPRVLLQWARAHFHVFRWDDPRPGLWAAAQLGRGLLARARQRLRGYGRGGSPALRES